MSFYNFEQKKFSLRFHSNKSLRLMPGDWIENEDIASFDAACEKYGKDFRKLCNDIVQAAREAKGNGVFFDIKEIGGELHLEKVEKSTHEVEVEIILSNKLTRQRTISGYDYVVTYANVIVTDKTRDIRAEFVKPVMHALDDAGRVTMWHGWSTEYRGILEAAADVEAAFFAFGIVYPSVDFYVHKALAARQNMKFSIPAFPYDMELETAYTPQEERDVFQSYMKWLASNPAA